MAEKKEDRCWPGYEPVAGKKPNSQGSCRPKADSKSSPSEKEFKAKRKRQLDKWQEKGGGKRQAAQHLSGPGNEPTSRKGAAKKKTATKKRAAKKTAKTKATTKKQVTTRKKPAMGNRKAA